MELNNFQFKRAAETIKFYLTESNIAINNVKPWDKTVPDDLRNRVLKDVFDVLTEATKFYSCYFPKEAEIARLALLNKEKVILFPRIKIS